MAPQIRNRFALAVLAAVLAGLAVGSTLDSRALAVALAAASAGLAFLAGTRAGRAAASPGLGALEAAREDAVRAAREEVVRAREERDDLQRTLAHDLRSPLGAIVNFASVLEEDHRGRLEPDALGIVARIRRAAESALRLAEGLSRLTRVSRGPFQPELVDVEALVREAFEAVTAGRRVELSIGELPPSLADRALLREAFCELLRNAVKFSARREKPRIGVGGRTGADGAVVYCVADDGVGFAPNTSSRLFRAFERLHPGDEFPGAGVGLAVVRRVAERHGGSVWAEGDPERGARFYLALPARSAA